MKVFGIGLSKTGTTSLSSALKLLGIKTNQFPMDTETRDELNTYLETGRFSLSVAEKYDAVIDVVPCVMFEGLYRKYPDAKYILTVRNVDEWFTSFQGLYERQLMKCMGLLNPGDEPNEIGKSLISAFTHIYGTEILDEAIYKGRFLKYNREIANFFDSEKNNNLLVMNITDGDGWNRLCPFLGLDTIHTPFPHANKTTLQTV